MRKLSKKEKIIKRILQAVLGFGFIFGLLMTAGGLGHIELMDEIHETISKAETIRSYMISFAGPFVSLLFYYIGWNFSILDTDYDDEF